MVYPIAKLIIVPFTRLFIKEVNGIENVTTERPFIIACNHASYFDDFAVPSVILPIIDKKIHFYANSYYFNNYFLRKFLEWGGSIPVDPRKGKNRKKINEKAFQTALNYLKNNEIIGIFPEGTRSVDGRLQQGRTGIAKLALGARVPVLPLGIIGSRKILQKGKFFPRPRRCRINIGKPLYFRKYYHRKPTKKALEGITRIIMKEIARLTGQKYNY
ncbi:MAG: lysophospholipid acyltransferase family protein [Candidatus Woesearchaeota archaeon]